MGSTKLPLLLLSPTIENVVEFSVFIEGRISNSFLKPRVRLILEEEGGRGTWYFPTTKVGKGAFEARIKLDPTQISDKLYRTYIEVILQDYYFVPVESLAKFDVNVLEPTITMAEVRGFKRKYSINAPTVIRVNENHARGISVSVGEVVVVANKPQRR